MTEAMIRELEEEIGIVATELHVSLTQQSSNISDGMTYFNAFFEVSSYTGKITNIEIDKCSELIFLTIEELQQEKIIPYVLHAIRSLRDGESFSEIRWSDTHDS